YEYTHARQARPRRGSASCLQPAIIVETPGKEMVPPNKIRGVALVGEERRDPFVQGSLCQGIQATGGRSGRETRECCDGHGERAEVRHLREFSRFLLPRAGVLETEFWGLAMTILGGLIPSLLTALAVPVIVWYFWALLLASLTIDSSWSARVMGVSLLVYLVGAEFWWGRSGKSEHNERETWGYSGGCGIGLSLAFIGWAVRKLWYPGAEFDQSAALLEPSVAFAPSALLGCCTLA